MFIFDVGCKYSYMLVWTILHMYPNAAYGKFRYFRCKNLEFECKINILKSKKINIRQYKYKYKMPNFILISYIYIFKTKNYISCRDRKSWVSIKIIKSCFLAKIVKPNSKIEVFCQDHKI